MQSASSSTKQPGASTHPLPELLGKVAPAQVRVAHQHPVAPDQFVKSFREIARGIAVGDMELSTAELIDLASACNQRLVHRLGNPALVLAV